MDLKNVLEKNKAKIEGANLIHKPINIADQDRPYSLPEEQNLQVFNNTTPPSVFTEDPPNIQIASIRSIETSSKVNTNLTQTQHKADTNLTQEPNTNSTQSEHDEVIVDTHETQTKHKPNTKLNTQKTQTQHKVHTNLTQTAHISTLIGVQRMILFFIFEECKKARSHTTEPLSIIHIASGLEIPLGSIKTSIARLCEKGFLRVHNFKNGRGGWSIYEIPDNAYKELLQIETQHKLHTNQTQTTHKVDTKPNTQPNTNGSSSSSSLNIKETTTSLPPEWLEIDLLEEKTNLNNGHLHQIYRAGYLSKEQVQECIFRFADFLENPLPNAKPINNPIAIFMKVVKVDGVMWEARKGYESPRDKAIRIELEYLREQEKKRLAMEKEHFDLSYNQWRAEVTQDFINKNFPHGMPQKGQMLEGTLKSIFKERFYEPFKEFENNG